jgi:hypothetical protein
MKQTKLIVIFLLGILLLLPFNAAAQENIIIENINITDKKAELDARFIERFGSEKYIKLMNDIEIAILGSTFKHCVYNYDDDGLVSTDIYPDKDILSDVDLEQLILICQMIAEFVMLLFGHNELGYFLAVFICYVLMFIPARLVSLPIMLEDYADGYLLQVVFNKLSGIVDLIGGWSEIFWEYGLIGGIVYMLFAFPVYFVIFIFALLASPLVLICFFPVVRMVYTFDILNYIVYNAFGVWERGE